MPPPPLRFRNYLIAQVGSRGALAQSNRALRDEEEVSLVGNDDVSMPCEQGRISKLLQSLIDHSLLSLIS